ncbi:hypothetical protein AwWohl_12410 [Gammaproteobacteria bacterium]|nr:hypothetical protein AwWohl_12410 [Gammaproteobacteria bacterium]
MKQSTKLSTLAAILLLSLSTQTFANKNVYLLDSLTAEQITQLKQISTLGGRDDEQNILRDVKQAAILTSAQRTELANINAGKSLHLPVSGGNYIFKLNNLSSEQITKLKQISAFGERADDQSILRDVKQAAILTNEQREQLRQMVIANSGKAYHPAFVESRGGH